MPIETYEGFKAAKQAAISTSQSSTYRDKYVHVEWIEDNFYQLNVTDFYLGDTDIAICFRNGEKVLSAQELADQHDIEMIEIRIHHEDDDCLDDDFPWSDDDEY